MSFEKQALVQVTGSSIQSQLHSLIASAGGTIVCQTHCTFKNVQFHASSLVIKDGAILSDVNFDISGDDVGLVGVGGKLEMSRVNFAGGSVGVCAWEMNDIRADTLLFSGVRHRAMECVRCDVWLVNVRMVNLYGFQRVYDGLHMIECNTYTRDVTVSSVFP